MLLVIPVTKLKINRYHIEQRDTREVLEYMGIRIALEMELALIILRLM